MLSVVYSKNQVNENTFGQNIELKYVDTGERPSDYKGFKMALSKV